MPTEEAPDEKTPEPIVAGESQADAVVEGEPEAPSRIPTGDNSREDDPQRVQTIALASKEIREEEAQAVAEGRNSRLIKGLNEQATLTEKWAGILYDHPVSEAFKEKYTYASTPVRLAETEISLQRESEALKAIEKGLEEMLPGNAPVGLLGRDKEQREHLRGHHLSIFNVLDKIRNPAEYEAAQTTWNELANDPNTTAKQLKTFYVEKYTQYILEPEQAEVQRAKTIVESVKNGQTNQYETGEPVAA